MSCGGPKSTPPGVGSSVVDRRLPSSGRGNLHIGWGQLPEMTDIVRVDPRTPTLERRDYMKGIVNLATDQAPARRSLESLAVVVCRQGNQLQTLGEVGANQAICLQGGNPSRKRKRRERGIGFGQSMAGPECLSTLGSRPAKAGKSRFVVGQLIRDRGNQYRGIEKTLHRSPVSGAPSL